MESLSQRLTQKLLILSMVWHLYNLFVVFFVPCNNSFVAIKDVNLSQPATLTRPSFHSHPEQTAFRQQNIFKTFQSHNRRTLFIICPVFTTY